MGSDTESGYRNFQKGVEELCLQLASLPSCIAGPWAGALDEKRWTTILPSRYVDYISGSCIAINRSVFEKNWIFLCAVLYVL